MPGADGVERADRPRGRLRHQRLRRVLFRSRHVMGGRGRRDPQTARRARRSSASRSRRATRRASISGIRDKHGLPYPPLRCSTEGIDRFLTRNTKIGIRRTQDGYDVYAPDGFDDVADLIVRPNPGPNFSRGELRGEGGAMEGAVAGDHGAAGGVQSRRRPCEADPYRRSIGRQIVGCFVASLPRDVWVPARRDDSFYRTTPDVNPALRRGGLMSFFRKQCASLPA